MVWRTATATLLMAMALAGAARAAPAPAPLRAELARVAAEVAAARGELQLAQLQPGASPSAALVARLQQLEEDLRRLTGRVEEVEHAQRQLEIRLQRLLDQRAGAGAGAAETARPAPAPLAAEEGPTSPAPAGPTPLTPRQASTATAARPATPAPQATAPTIEPDEAARRGYVLGTIPEDALRGQPTPRQPDATAPGQSAALPSVQGSGAPPASYEAGLELLQANRWAEAEQAFAAFVQQNPDDPRAATASYWLGETYLLRKDYATAAATFARNYRTYGESAPRAPDNLLKLGVALAALGQRDKACQSFAELAKRHPNASAPIRQALSRERAAAGCT